MRRKGEWQRVRKARKTRERERERESRADQQSSREILAVSQVAAAAARRYYVRVKIIRDMNLRRTLWPAERKKHEDRAKREKEAQGGERSVDDGKQSLSERAR